MTPEYKPIFRDSQAAFQNAIDSGFLTDWSGAQNFAGNFMYMSSDSKTDGFKNINTRKYINVPYNTETTK